MTIGLRDLFYAKCTETDEVETYGDIKQLAKAITADLSVKTAGATLYADDALCETVTEFVNGTLKLGVDDIGTENAAEILGQTVDQNKIVWSGKDDEAPYIAIGFRAKKTGGRYRYVWLLKCKAKTPSEKYETKGESIKFNTPEIELDIVARKKDGNWKADFVGKESDTIAQGWFLKVPEPDEPLQTA